MHKDPKKRPSLDQLMSDPFFAEIDWDKLEKRQVEPPVILCKGGNKPRQEFNDNDEFMVFESNEDAKVTENERGGEVASKQIFDDEDYNYENKNYHRVKNYSFARWK